MKYFEMIHFGLPSCTLSSIFGKVYFNFDDVINYYSSIGELSRKALNCEFLLSVEFEKNFEKDIEELKYDLKIN